MMSQRNRSFLVVCVVVLASGSGGTALADPAFYAPLDLLATHRIANSSDSGQGVGCTAHQRDRIDDGRQEGPMAMGGELGYYVKSLDEPAACSSSDPWFYFVYDDQWRIVATYRGSDSTPKEQFIYHAAGDDEFGGSSYIDATVLRDRDMSNGWAGTPNGSLEERTYYCQNWRADVVALVSGTGSQVQQVRYGEYGEAFGLPRGDTDGDGDVNNGDTVDTDQVQTWISGGTPAYDVRGDLDLDGDVDATDKTNPLGMTSTVLDWGALSLSVGSSAGGNRKGYAGYENDGVLDASMIYHVRLRVYHTGLGRWKKRHPADMGLNLSAYGHTNALRYRDPWGLFSQDAPMPDPPERPGMPSRREKTVRCCEGLFGRGTPEFTACIKGMIQGDPIVTRPPIEPGECSSWCQAHFPGKDNASQRVACHRGCWMMLTNECRPIAEPPIPEPPFEEPDDGRWIRVTMCLLACTYCGANPPCFAACLAICAVFYIADVRNEVDTHHAGISVCSYNHSCGNGYHLRITKESEHVP